MSSAFQDQSPVSLPAGFDQAEAEFLAAYPEYQQTGELDGLRASDYPNLDSEDQVYLDSLLSG